MNWTSIAATAVVAGLAAATPAQAAVIPFGVQNNIAYAEVVGSWGWTLLYRDSYRATNVSIADAFAGAGTHVMLGAMRAGSSEIALLAAAPTADVLTYTAWNTTRSANGAEWYFNGVSMGFAGQGDAIAQVFGDTAGAGENDRLSWHTAVGAFNQNPAVAPTTILGGYRAGAAIALNRSTEWDRVIFTLARVDVPEPASLAILGLGLLGFATAKRRRVTAAAAG